MGGDSIGGTGGTFLPKFKVGDGPCIRPPIFGEVALWDSRESTKCLKMRDEGIFCKIEVFRKEKGHIGLQ